MKVRKGSANDPRSVVSQGVIGLAICVGGYMMTVDPVNAKLAAAKAEEASLRAQTREAETLRDIVPQITAATARARSEADRIHEAGRLARNEQDLYAALTSIANECNVRIDQMSPVKITGKSTLGQAADPNASGLNAATGYAIDAAADYTDLTRFLRRIRTELGFAIVKSVRLTPTMDTRVKTVQAYIETEHYSFDASPMDSSAPSGGAR